MTDRWSPNDLDVIGTTDELAVAPTRTDGSRPGYTTIWVVRVGGDLYVRSYRGAAGGWYRAAQRSREGRVWAGGAERDVRFARPADAVGHHVDNAYRAKYGRSGYVEAMVTPEAAATTLRVVPR